MVQTSLNLVNGRGSLVIISGMDIRQGGGWGLQGGGGVGGYNPPMEPQMTSYFFF